MSRLGLALLIVLITGCANNAVPGMDDEQRDKAVRSRIVAGMEYLRQGEPSQARRHLIRAVELDDGSAEAHNALSLLYKYEGDAEREEYHLRKALRANPDYGPARNNYGTFFLDRGELERALRQFQRAADITSYTGRDLAYQNMGSVYVALNRDDEAIEAFNKALRLNSEATLPMLEMAALYLDRDRADVARRYYDQYASRVDTQSARGFWVGIRVMHAVGDQDAQSSYELALQNIYPQSRELRLWQEWRQARGGS